MNKLFYTQSGKKIAVTISQHAVERYVLRNFKLFPFIAPINKNAAIERISSLFSSAKQIAPKGRLKKRSQKYGNKSLYFVNGIWRFIVVDGVVVTVELINKAKGFN